ncbi:TPA: GNAT family N-acetyltransferase [Photobacterium damselae]|uniref:GNAT family N-acetyltransferase n=1 Tax=Photobacterium damselae TaxID=38293 RepID=UPI00370C4C9E
MIDDKNKIIDFVIRSDNEFIPSLSSRVNLEEYTNKLINNAVILTNNCNGVINALLGGYNNNEIAYVSYLYVDECARGQGISKKLLNKFIEKSNENGNRAIRLTVRKESSAYYLYSNFGFCIINEFKYTDVDILGVTMELVL